jgi:organic hydroperoxide reductase OsmC/OhrA
MSEHVAEVVWERGDAPFLDQRYSRRHALRFDGGAVWAGSSSPHVVPAPMSDPSAVDPEEGFVASISSCHMLWFLSIAAKHGFVVDHYRDRAIGLMGKDAHGRLAITRVTLKPEVRFAGTQEPDEVEVAAMHHEAHESCFIANSVKTEIRCEPEV